MRSSRSRATRISFSARRPSPSRKLAELAGHLTVAEAQDTARRANARRLVLTHRSSEWPVPDGVEIAGDGLVLHL